MMAMKRNRRSYATVVACVIAVGLASRSDLAAHLPPFIATYAGDTLLLGSGFLTSDLLCYTAGVLRGVAGEAFVMKRKKKGLLSRCGG